MRTPTEDMMIDRVDENDEVIGPINRQNIFREQANFRTVHIFVVNSKGEILLQKISPDKDRYPGFWGSSAAGYIFSGESYEEASARKSEQDLGLKDVKPQFLTKTHVQDENNKKFIGLFRIEYEGPFYPDTAQVEEVKFFPPEEIDEMIKTDQEKMTPAFKQLFAEYKKLS